ncbi:SDR family NAD(P)-dependent oxidoreductase [Pseudaestuariivita sp.]|uniref:SDR family NAD(P)-dependent oxidoreductase n=1 Tax=Pseudaestuariivita sp. TaxID=2211669 RepID=UPI00405A4B38
MAEQFEGRVALVTGVGKPTGLGYAICEALLTQGMSVYLTARTSAQAEALAGALSAKGWVHPLSVDIADDRQVREAASLIEKTHGKLDILINNAAKTSAYGETAAEVDLAAAQSVLDVTLFGTWRMCQVMLPLLRQSDAGRIVNVSSGAGSHGDPAFGLTTGNQMGTSYAVSKAALNALTVKLALEEEGSSVKINAVCPGFTATFEGGLDMGARPPAESAKGIVWAATLPADGPTAGFFRDGAPLAW